MPTELTAPNRMDIARNVARIVFETSYRSGDIGVHDLLLYGSTLTGVPYKPPIDGKSPDVDMLVVHRLHTLDDFGMFTVYDGEKRGVVPDPNGDITKQRYRAEVILDYMGSELGPDNHETMNILSRGDNETEGLRGQIQNLRDGNRYGGVVTLPLIGTVDIPVQEFDRFRDGFDHIHDAVDAAYNEKVGSKFTINRVKQYLEQRGLPIAPVLDLIVMHRDLLDSEKGHQERELALQQSSDPTFWYHILTTGMLYNMETGEFDLPFDANYPGAVKLFKPE